MGPSAPPVPVLHVTLKRAGEEILGVVAQVRGSLERGRDGVVAYRCFAMCARWDCGDNAHVQERLIEQCAAPWIFDVKGGFDMTRGIAEADIQVLLGLKCHVRARTVRHMLPLPR